MIGPWLQQISPSLYKSICGVFILMETSEVKTSVLSLPLQTENNLLDSVRDKMPFLLFSAFSVVYYSAFFTPPFTSVANI